jgi:hypothetical protein
MYTALEILPTFLSASNIQFLSTNDFRSDAHYDLKNNMYLLLLSISYTVYLGRDVSMVI